MKRWIVIVLALAGLALVSGTGYYGYISSRQTTPTAPTIPDTSAVGRCDVQQTISAPGSVTGTREQAIQMPADGELSEILVRLGEAVNKGHVLARLDDPHKYEEAVATARLALLEAQRALEDLRSQAPLKTAEAHNALLEAQKALEKAKSGRLSKSYQRASDETIAVARANLALAAAEVDRAEEIYEIHKGRDEADPERASALSSLAKAKQEYYRHQANLNWLLTGPTDLEIAQADTAIELAQATYDSAQAAWNRVKEGPDALLLSQAQAKVDQAQAQLEQAETVLASVEIRAPFDGVIAEVKVRPGEAVMGGAEILTLIDPEALEVEVTVVEEELPLVKEGMAASLFFDALPDEIISGRVVSIIPRRVSGESPQYKIIIAIDHIPAGLASGMTADASIIIQERKDALCLPRGLVRASGTDTAMIEVWNGAAVEKREVTLGLRGDQNIEILAGLSEGDQVVLK